MIAGVQSSLFFKLVHALTLNVPPPERIQWHEGMLLSPQHFQQESARVDALLAWHGLIANPYAWGVRRLDIDQGLLATGLLRVTALDVVMPDGTAVVFVAGQMGGVLEFDLLPLAESLEQAPMNVYLTMGRARSMRDPGQPSRFRGVQASSVEDEVSEALPVDVPRMCANLALTAGAVPQSVVMHLQLLTVQKDNEVFKLGAYMPAMVELPQGSTLRGRAQVLAGQMRSKAAFLAKQTAAPSSRIEDRLGMLEQRERLGNLSAMLPLLEAVLRSPVVMPYALYLALCAQLGGLSMLRPGAVPFMPAPWKHTDPWSVFEPLLQSIEDSVGEVSQDWRTQVFGFKNGVFSLEVEQQWLGKTLVIGLRGPSERELVTWMAGAVVGSETVWTSLSDRRVLGASRKRIDEAPELGVRSSVGYTLFSIEVSSETIVAGQALVISNSNESRAAVRPQELVLFIKG